MEITKLSTKGQVVLPEAIRRGISIGSAFLVTRKDDLIVLKKIDELSSEEEAELEELNKIWKDIDAGQCDSYEEEQFFEQLRSW